MASTAPYGSWSSPLAADALARAARRLSQPRLHRGRITWLEGRPEEGGRQQVRRARAGGGSEALTPAGHNVRSRVHEYGGGDYGYAGDTLVYVDHGTPGIQCVGREPVRGTLSDARYADLVGSPDGRFLVAVEEAPAKASDRLPGEPASLTGEPQNRLVCFDLILGERRVLVEGRDFVAQPVFAPGSNELACIAWDHPNMPWDGTDLLRMAFGARGPASDPRRVAGGADEAIFQPGFAADGGLYYVTDRSGWWNLVRLGEAGPVPVCPRSAEFGRPMWVLGLSSWAFESAAQLLCIFGEDGEDHLARLDLRSGTLSELTTPFTELEGLRVEGGVAVFLGASPIQAATVCRLDLATGKLEELARAFDGFDESEASQGDLWSRPQAVSFPSADGRIARAFFYAPHRRGWRGAAGTRPPLLVKSHGGPTSATSSSLRLPIQYWTSRGFAVIDVNYAGSTGYGRSYRNALRGAWGVADVDDCVAAARFAADQGWADPARLAITGGSAGGYTTLCALTFRDLFAAGASHYGIGDLESLARDSHKFEAHYLDRLLGPYPEEQALYRARSPIHFTEQLSCPVIFLQGLDDPIVPPNQAEAMVAALEARGIPHAYVTFAGEGHGFRAAESIRRALESELSFYAYVFGFPLTGVPPVEIRSAAGPRP